MGKFIVVGTLFFSVSLIAGEQTTTSPRTRLCESWRYSSEVNGTYTCQWLSGYVSLVESREYENRIGELERRVEALEAKLQQPPAK